MVKFLSQFKLLDNFSIEHRFIDDKELLAEAIKLGYVKNWKPPKGCTYRDTAICTPKGRLYLKNLNKSLGGII